MPAGCAAVVAIFLPRRRAMAWKLAANCGCRLAVCAVRACNAAGSARPAAPELDSWAR